MAYHDWFGPFDAFEKMECYVIAPRLTIFALPLLLESYVICDERDACNISYVYKQQTELINLM